MQYTTYFEKTARYKNFILTTHESPDGDGLGSEYALYRVLKRNGKNPIIVNADPAANRYSFIFQDIPMHDKSVPDASGFGEFCLVILDTNDLENIGGIKERYFDSAADYIIIDHHETSEDIIQQHIIEKSASSTCEIMYDIFRSGGIEIDRQMALSLFAGIVYDTGSFIYPKTSAHTFEIAYELCRLGVDPAFVHNSLFENNSRASLKLQAMSLNSLEYHFDGKVAVQNVTATILRSSGASYDEIETLVNIPLKCREIRVSILFKRNERGILRCSLRSKASIDVAEIARHFDGGGHRTAAGFKCPYQFRKSKRVVLDLLSGYFKA